MTRWLVACAPLMLAGCQEASSPTDNAARAEAAPKRAAVAASAPSKATSPVAPWDASRCGDDDYQNAAMERHPRLMGSAPERLRAAFGPPATTKRFVLGDAVGTFRGGRAAGLPGGEAANARRVALEDNWVRNGCTFTVRYLEHAGRWRAFEAFEWSVGADF